jgi:hypothetical protein
MAMLALLTAITLASPLDSSVVIATQLEAAQLELEQAELPAPPSLTDLIRAQSSPEVLQGFDTILLTQINAIFGSERLPVANGGPVEPGIYVTVSPQQLLIFDAKVSDLQDGVVPPGPASRECKSGCKASLWSAFRAVWLRSLEEAQTFVLEVPVRVLFAAEASVPAKTLVELAYAAGETRPGSPPSFSLLVNGSNAGLRARNFHVLPPGGLRVSPGDGESFTISAAHPRFAPNIEGTGWKALASELTRIKKGYPNKDAIIIDVGDDATVGDVVMVMVAAQKHFSETVLTNGLPVKWG